MKLISKIILFSFLGFILAQVKSTALAGDSLFTVVPANDSTYMRLQQLEQAGLLASGSAIAPLTRFEVVNLILRAQDKYNEIVVADSDLDLPAPLDTIVTTPAPATAPSVATPVAAVPAKTAAPTPLPTPDEAVVLAQALKSLHSLQEAYQYELTRVKGEVKTVEDHEAAVENSQYALWKRLQGITEYPTITWHGLGRAFGISRQYWGDPAYSSLGSAEREGFGYLDFQPIGVVSKQVRWDAVLRYQTAFESNNYPGIDWLMFRRATMEFNPSWFSATVGDFEESYTPLTLWNRNNLDLRYMPEMYKRADDTYKYENYLNQEPDWPFRGARIGTALLWPDSELMDQFKVSLMADMIRNGFDDNNKTGVFYGFDNYTGWVVGTNGEIKLKRCYLGGGTSLQLTLDAYGLLLDDPLNTNKPGAPYSPYNSDTWGHQYRISSFKPALDAGIGGDTSIGIVWEWASVTYVDDKMDSSKNTQDYAVLGGPYLRMGRSKVSFNYLNVGPYFYSPMAQTRQDNISVPSAAAPIASGFLPTPELFTPALRSRFFLNDVPRPDEIYSFYDRTQDNTFPYGLSTPNRQGGGMEMDLKALEKDALNILGSVYFVQEISGNLVVDSAGTGYVPVDAAAFDPVPVRNFTYVNFGPSLNLGPVIGFDRDLVLGTNVRYEKTTSSIGTLTNTWILGGVKIGILNGWDVSASYGNQAVNGTEAGYAYTDSSGVSHQTFLARYPFLFDNSDLGNYQPFSVNGSNQSVQLSSEIRTSRNTRFFADYGFTSGNVVPYVGTPNTGTLHNEFLELTYEIQF